MENADWFALIVIFSFLLNIVMIFHSNSQSNIILEKQSKISVIGDELKIEIQKRLDLEKKLMKEISTLSSEKDAEKKKNLISEKIIQEKVSNISVIESELKIEKQKRLDLQKKLMNESSSLSSDKDAEKQKNLMLEKIIQEKVSKISVIESELKIEKQKQERLDILEKAKSIIEVESHYLKEQISTISSELNSERKT